MNSLNTFSDVPIATRPCNESDFGIDGVKNPESPFFDHLLENGQYLKQMMPQLICIAQNLTLYGDFNSLHSQEIFLSFNPCNSTARETCKSDEEIESFLVRKYLVLVHNKKTFKQEGYGEDKFNEQVHLDWLPLNT